MPPADEDKPHCGICAHPLTIVQPSLQPRSKPWILLTLENSLSFGRDWKNSLFVSQRFGRVQVCRPRCRQHTESNADGDRNDKCCQDGEWRNRDADLREKGDCQRNSNSDEDA